MNMIDTTITTIHGVQRAKERCNLKSIRAAEKQIALALTRGKVAEDFTSWEQDYLRNEAYDGCVAVAYNNFCYIINTDGRCVTLHALPNWFGRKKHFDGKDRIRNPKRYAKLNATMELCDTAC